MPLVGLCRLLTPKQGGRKKLTRQSEPRTVSTWTWPQRRFLGHDRLWDMLRMKHRYDAGSRLDRFAPLEILPKLTMASLWYTARERCIRPVFLDCIEDGGGLWKTDVYIRID